jgi:AraC family transcriptional regulator of adaptative response / DNA-3-methyladenine glycosylase II
MDLDHAACYRALTARDPRFDGRFFTAVRTTGIYCRPICPARTPKAENCIFYPTAAAAQEAGFRPCLRCRPESSPDLGAWRGTSSTVSRALTLIEAGALDEADVAAVADRLGVGERQLRRLFHRHLGASPVAVAQTRRVLLAKQLLHETRLPMTDVALASGFGSVRRFNETFQQLYGRPPGELRRGRLGVGETDAIILSLPYRPPYDWSALIGFLAARAIPGVEAVEDGVYRRTIALDGAAGTITISHQPERNALRATIRFARLTALPTIIARIRRVFDLGADPQVIGFHLAGDPALAPLVAARAGLRVPGAWDGFEIAVRAILGQQITVGAATRLAGKLVDAYGERLDAPEGRLTHLFPEPRRLAGADVASLGMPRSRGAAIAGLAAAAVEEPRLFHPRGDLDAAVARLRSLPGIGEWTAQYIAMRGLREPDAFPAADIGLLRALADENGRRPSPEELLARAENWRPWRAYAALHLWAADPAAPKQASREDHASHVRPLSLADRNDSARL